MEQHDTSLYALQEQHNLQFSQREYDEAVSSETVKVTGQRVARRIRELRLERSLTLADLATRLAELDRSYTLSTLSRIEQGKRRVDTDELVALALALDVPPNAILFPPDEHHEARTKLTANIEADTAAVLRWAASGDTAGLSGRAAPAIPIRPIEQSLPVGPVHRSIIAVDLEGSTARTRPDRAQVRRILYDLLGQALQEAGIGPKHLEPHTDRGDGLLILIRPHDDMPKTLFLGRLIPVLTTLLVKHNASVTRPELRMRLRAVVHAGELHEDANGFYGDDLDAAFRLLEAPTLKKALKEAAASPLILVVSEEIFNGIVQESDLDDGPYRPLVRVRVGRRQRRGWVHIPAPIDSGRPIAQVARTTNANTHAKGMMGSPLGSVL